MCFGINVTAFSTTLKNAQYERLSSAHSPAVEKNAYYWGFFYDNDLLVQWYITSSTVCLGIQPKTCEAGFSSHLSASSGLSRFLFCRQADALPKLRSVNTGFCILKATLWVPRWQHIKPHGAYRMSFIPKSLGPFVNMH